MKRDLLRIQHRLMNVEKSMQEIRECLEKYMVDEVPKQLETPVQEEEKSDFSTSVKKEEEVHELIKARKI